MRRPLRGSANLEITLNRRSVEALAPGGKPCIAWDDRLTGFGVRDQPSGVRSCIVTYRADSRPAGGAAPAGRRPAHCHNDFLVNATFARVHNRIALSYS